MKKAEEYLDCYSNEYDMIPSNKDVLYSEETVLKYIKQAQIDAIEEAIKLCTEKAEVEIYYIDYDKDAPCLRINELSILKCAEILKKEVYEQNI